MKIFSYNPIHFEQWDYRQCASGIGGSEQHGAEMAWRLQRRGHDVTVFAPIPDDCPPEWRGTKWRGLDEADFSEPGLWLLYRCPEVLDKFSALDKDQPRWFIAQDETYGPRLTQERADKLDKYLALSPEHKKLTDSAYPLLGDKVEVTSNGIKCDLIEEIEAEGIPERNPCKLIYASSPDRGLESLIEIFSRAREYEPALELHIFYGFNNIDKLIVYEKRFAHYKAFRERIMRLMDRQGIFFHGRVSQKELYREWMSAGMFVYPTEFFETSCISCMEAQALGAIPIFNSYGALKDNIDFGISVPGWPYRDMLTQCRYVGETVKLANELEWQEAIREPMMREARKRFDWERWVNQWSGWINDLPKANARVKQSELTAQL